MPQPDFNNTSRPCSYDATGDHIRLYNPATQRYLHMSAQTETAGTAYAWLGTRRQAGTLRNRARIAGQPWPYRPAPKHSNA